MKNFLFVNFLSFGFMQKSQQVELLHRWKSFGGYVVAVEGCQVGQKSQPEGWLQSHGSGWNFAWGWRIWKVQPVCQHQEWTITFCRFPSLVMDVATLLLSLWCAFVGLWYWYGWVAFGVKVRRPFLFVFQLRFFKNLRESKTISNHFTILFDKIETDLLF